VLKIVASVEFRARIPRCWRRG